MIPRRALVVIDVQNEYFTGNLPIEHPDPRVSLRNIARAMDAAINADIPVVVVQNSAPASSPIFAKGGAGWQLHDSVAARGCDHYVEKSLPSAFAGTDLGDWIARSGIDTLCLAGYMTHNCIAATALHAVHAGIAVEVLSDATGSVPYANSAGRADAEQIHRVFCTVFQSRFASVLDTDAWIAALATGRQAPRDSIIGSNRNARGTVGAG
jgi:nicotinamidase-related amidase